MDTPITGITVAATKAAGPDTAGISTASPTAAAASLNTEPTRQDWLEIFLGLATQLEFPLVRLKIENQQILHAVILSNVWQQDNGEFIIPETKNEPND